jgi:hypothetical protein
MTKLSQLDNVVRSVSQVADSVQAQQTRKRLQTDIRLRSDEIVQIAPLQLATTA